MGGILAAAAAIGLALGVVAGAVVGVVGRLLGGSRRRWSAARVCGAAFLLLAGMVAAVALTHVVTAALDVHTPAATTPSWRETYVLCMAGVLILVGIAIVSVAPLRRSPAGGTALRRTAGVLALSVIIAGSGVLVLQRVRPADRRVQRLRTAPSCSPAGVPSRGCLARAPVVVALVSEGGGIGFERLASPSTPTTMQPAGPCPGARPGIRAVAVVYDGAIQALETPAGACENVASVGHAAGDALESNAENLGAAGFLAAALAGVLARFRRRAG